MLNPFWLLRCKFKKFSSCDIASLFILANKIPRDMGVDDEEDNIVDGTSQT